MHIAIREIVVPRVLASTMSVVSGANKSDRFSLVVRFDLAEQTAGSFDDLVQESLPLIAEHEPGTLLYACHKVEGEVNARIFYEVYADRSAFDAHECQPHVKRFLVEREQYLVGPPRVEFLQTPTGKGLPELA